MIPFLICMVCLVVYFFVHSYEAEEVLGSVGCIGGALTFSIWIVLYFNSLSTQTDMRSFYETKPYANYIQLVQAQIDAGVIGDYSNKEVGPRLIQNLEDWYKKINTYNENLFYYRRFNQNWFMASYIPNDFEDLKIINLDSIRTMMIPFNKKVNNMNGTIILAP